MAETIPGGAYQDTKGNWFDAEGKPISAPPSKASTAMKAAEPAHETGDWVPPVSDKGTRKA